MKDGRSEVTKMHEADAREYDHVIREVKAKVTPRLLGGENEKIVEKVRDFFCLR